MKRLAMIGLIFAMFFAIGCNKSGGSNTPSSNSNSPSTIGPKGGTLTTTDGNATLIVPSGALSNNTAISISKSASDKSIGALQTPYSFSPSGLTFNTPATITLKYDLTGLPNGANEANVKVAYELNGQWIPIPESTVNTTNHTVSAPVTHFSDYGYVYVDALDTPEGNFSGVVVYSNNHGYPTSPSNQYYNAGDPYYLHNNGRSHYENGHLTGEEWQCVEYVARYYWLIYSHEVRLTTGSNNALDFWDTADLRGLQKYWNGTTKPQPGDIVVFRKINKDNTLSGHVAIVREVTADKVYIAQQNWYHNAKDANAELNYYNVTNYLETFNHDSSAYKVIGLLRLTVTTLASGLYGPYAIALDSTNIYIAELGNTYCTSGAIKKVGLNGGTVTILASGLGCPMTIAADSSNIYWAEWWGNAIKKVGLNGGTITTLASANQPRAIAIDSTDIYWIENCAVKKIGLNGGVVTTLASLYCDYSGTRRDIAIDSNNVYWVESPTSINGAIKKVGINGGEVATIASNLNSPYAIAVDSSSVYWVEYGVNLGTGAVKKVGLNGGVVTTLASDGATYDIAIDSTNVYWTDSSSATIKKVGLNGGTTTIIASGTPGFAITLDSNNIYWSELGSGYTNYYDGTIKKISK